MSKHTSSRTARRLALCAASALGVVFAASIANAESADGGRYQPVAYTQNDNDSDDIIVTAPRQRNERSAIGAPIRDVAMTQEVSFDDLDLTTNHGARELKNRVRQTARNLCHQLDVRYPVTADRSPDCYTTASNDALAQADDAIADARRYARGD